MSPAPLAGLPAAMSGRRQLPVVMQAEAAECGLACLVMVAHYHGHRLDLRALRCRFPVSTQGLNLRHLMDFATQMNLSPRALRVEMAGLSRLQLPCIVHWGMNHFVVLKQVKGQRLVVHDPALGRRVYTFAQASNYLTGVALELAPTGEFKPRESRRKPGLAVFWSRIVGIRRSLASIALLSLVLQLAAIASPFYLQIVVDDVLLRRDANLLLVLALGFGLLLLVETGVGALRQLVVLHLSTRLAMQMSENVFRHLIQLPLDYFHKRHLGDILSRFGSLENLRQLITTGLVSVLVDGVMVLVTLAIMFVYSAKLTFIAVAVVGLYAGVRAGMYQPMKRLTQEGVVAAAKTESSFMESIRAIQLVKLFQKEGERQSQWKNGLVETLNRQVQLEKLGVVHTASNKMLYGAGHIVVIYFAAQAVMGGAMTLGMVYAFMSFMRRFGEATDGLIEQFVELRMVSVHLDRLADIVYAEKEAMSSTVSFPAPGKSGGSGPPGALGVRGVSYRYGAVGKPVFENVSLQVAAGEWVAIVGPSGSGKTTLLKCLMGLLCPFEGQVYWGGTSVFLSADYRRRIAGVMQDDRLLSGSLVENIACFDQKINLDRVQKCAEVACIHEDIVAMPMQYNTLVGDMGSSLSGGQQQRVVLARALYRQPEILFMDEATSHLDAEVERRVVRNLSALDITRVVVAHRRETIAAADRVIEFS